MSPYQKAKELFYNKDYSHAQQIFTSLNCPYEAGFCAFLEGDEKGAKNLWENSKNKDIATLWGLCVLDLIRLKIRRRPSFFQVRAFLEVYLNLLIENEQYAWAENIISASNFLVECNPEAYKFVARVLFANNYLDLTLRFVELSKDVFPLDPEALYIEAQTHYLKKDYKKAKDAALETLIAVPDYNPAKEFLKEIENKLKTP